MIGKKSVRRKVINGYRTFTNGIKKISNYTENVLLLPRKNREADTRSNHIKKAVCSAYEAGWSYSLL